jgi:DNA-binding transcriptional ArsR family regulator
VDPKSDLVKMFKALAHPNRFRLFISILEAESARFDDGQVCFLHAIMDRLDIGAPTVSHHLKELVNAGLVQTERQGKYLTCQSNPEALRELRAFFARS